MPIVEITNKARAQRGVHTTGGLVMLEPGESRTGLDVPDAELADLPEYLEIANRAAAPAGVLAHDADPLETMTVSALKALAAQRGVALPETGSGGEGRVVKADIIAALKAGRTEPQGDALDAMSDDELRAAVQALTGAEAPADADRAALIALARG